MIAENRITLPDATNTLSGPYVTLYKMHGAENDFLFRLPADQKFPLTTEFIAEICDRHRGIGADGFIDVVRQDDQNWFMDYRNADGSIAQMCGNAIRCFVHLLVLSGEIELNRGNSIKVQTRGGEKRITRVNEDEYCVEMGPVEVIGDIQVRVPGIEGELRGKYALAPNPHVVCAVTPMELEAAQLTWEPTLAPRFSEELPEGTNLELVTVESFEADTKHLALRVRVLERGVGETRACGTGACAVAAVFNPQGGTTAVKLPGGTLKIETTALGDGTPVAECESRVEARMTGPAKLVARVQLCVERTHLKH